MKPVTKRTLTLLLSLVFVMAALYGCGVQSQPAAATQAPAAPATEAAAADAPAEPEADGVMITKHTIAASVPLQGNLMQYGTSYRNAIELAVEDFNAAGGLNGEPVVLKVFDDKGDQKEAINIANNVIENKDIFTVIGSYGSSVSMAAAPVYQDAQMPMISPNTSHPDYPGIGNMMVPLSCKSEVIFGGITEMLFEKFGACNLAIIYQNTDVGITTMEVVRDTFTKLGGTVCAAETFVPGQTKDFSPLLSKIKSTQPQLMLLVAEYSDGAAIVHQTKQLGMDDVQLVGIGNVFKQEFLDIAGREADGMLLMGIARIYTDDVMANSDYGAYVTDIVTRYNAKYAADSGPFDSFAAFGYDAAMAAMVAATQVGTEDPARLADQIRAFDFTMASGQASFNEAGDLTREIFTFTVVDGAFTLAD